MSAFPLLFGSSSHSISHSYLFFLFYYVYHAPLVSTQKTGFYLLLYSLKNRVNWKIKDFSAPITKHLIVHQGLCFSHATLQSPSSVRGVILGTSCPCTKAVSDAVIRPQHCPNILWCTEDLVILFWSALTKRSCGRHENQYYLLLHFTDENPGTLRGEETYPKLPSWARIRT